MLVRRLYQSLHTFSTSFSKPIPTKLALLQHQISDAVSKSHLSIPIPEQSEFFYRFTVLLNREDGFLDPVNVFYSTFSRSFQSRYIQVSFDSQASEIEADARALSLALAFGCADLPMASSCVLIRSPESDFSAQERSVLINAIVENLAQVHPKEKDGFLWSHSLKFRREAVGVACGSVLQTIAGTIKDATVVFSHFSEEKVELCRVLDKEKARIIGASEFQGAILSLQEGLSIPDFLTHYEKHKTVKGFDGGVTKSSFQSLIKEKKDFVLINNPQELQISLNSRFLAETDFLILSSDDENLIRKSGTIVIPGCLMNIGEAISAFFALSTNLKTVPKSWKPDQKVLETVEKMVKSKVRQEKKREDMIRNAVKTVADSVAKTILKESRDSGRSLRQEAILRGVARMNLEDHNSR